MPPTSNLKIGEVVPTPTLPVNRSKTNEPVVEVPTVSPPRKVEVAVVEVAWTLGATR